MDLIPQVIDVDKNPAYPAAGKALKADGTLARRPLFCVKCEYLNSLIEQDHRAAKRFSRLAEGPGAFQSAWRTLEGIETMNLVAKLGHELCFCKNVTLCHPSDAALTIVA